MLAYWSGVMDELEPRNRVLCRACLKEVGYVAMGTPIAPMTCVECQHFEQAFHSGCRERPTARILKLVPRQEDVPGKVE